MTALRRFLLRLYSFLRPQHAEGELARELASHLTLLEDEFQRRGMTPDEARRAARRASGGVEQAKELHRDARSFTWLDDARRDVRYAARMLARNPGFSSVVVVTLALGIGAVTAIFSVADATILRPLPYPDADRLVALRSIGPSRGQPDGERTARGNLADWQAHTRSFEAITGYRWRTVDLTGSGRSERLRGLSVTPEFFDVFGVRQQIGRGFVASDRGTAPIVLSRHVWRRRFNADPRVVGNSLDVNALNFQRAGPTPHVVVGVVAGDVHFPPLTADYQLGISSLQERIDFWTAGFVASTNERESRELDVVGKLRLGVTIAEAQAEMNTIAGRLAELHPASNRDWGIRVVPLRDHVAGGARGVVLLLFLSSGIVLLIACSNVAGLLLVRGMARQKEVAIRAVLGAGRFRILRQFLIESALLALPVALLGLVLTSCGIALLRPLLASSAPLVSGVEVNLNVLGFALLAALTTTCLTGIVVVLGVGTLRSRNSDLKGLAARGLSPDRSRRRRAGALVVVQLALALTLLIGTGLLVKSAIRLLEVDPGFDPASLLTMTISLPSNKFEWKHNVVFSRQVIESVQSLHQVEAAAVVQGLPMRTGSFWGPFIVEGGVPTDPADPPVARLRVVSPGYFRVMQIPLMAGRDFDARDEVGEIGFAPQVIVSRALASRYWPGQDAVGQRIGYPETGQWSTIIGVAGDVRYAGMDADPGVVIYLPEGLFPQAAITLLARTDGDPLSRAADIRSRIAQIDKEAFVSDVRSMEAVIDDSLASRRLSTMLLMVFAGVALVLALVGIYGVIAQSVAQRQAEIGIRMALGAEQSDVTGLVLRQTILLTAVGVALGLVGAASVTRRLEGLLFGLSPLDVTTFAAVALLFASVAMLTAYLPARRAAGIDPAATLRCD